MAKNLIKVGDYYYENRKTASLAENELKAVEYMRENLDLDKPEELFAAYEQMIEKKVFVTEIGMSFLEDIRNYLKVYATLATKLSPIYPIESLAVKNVKREKAHYKEDRRRELAVTKADKAIDPKKAQKAAVEVLSGEAAYKTEKKRKKKEKVKTSKEKIAKVKDTSPVDSKYRELFYLTLTISIVLFIAIVSMFIITSTSDNINILNYENEIIDKYSTWEQELTDKEKELEAWEKDLSLR